MDLQGETVELLSMNATSPDTFTFLGVEWEYRRRRIVLKRDKITDQVLPEQTALPGELTPSQLAKLLPGRELIVS